MLPSPSNNGILKSQVFLGDSPMPTRFYPHLLSFFSGNIDCITDIPTRLDPPYESPLVAHPVSSPREFMLLRLADVLPVRLADEDIPESIEIGQELLCLIEEWMMQYGDSEFYQESNDDLPQHRIWKIVGRYCRLLSALDRVRPEIQIPIAFDELLKQKLHPKL